MEEHIEISNLSLDNNVPKTRRRKLLPWWIKVFIWLFLIFGAIAPIAFVIGLFGANFQLSLYGFETNEPNSLVGFALFILFGLKGIAAYGLWTEKDWAIKIAQIDAIIGIFICLLKMVFIPLLFLENGFQFNFRLELILLIPYLIKLQNIKEIWIKSLEAK